MAYFLLFMLCWLLVNNWLLFESLMLTNDGQLDDGSQYMLGYIFVNAILTIFFNLILIYSINTIRNLLRDRENMIPNEKLVNIHIANFALNSVFIII